MARQSKALTVLAFGARGTGKTYWARQYIEAQRPARLIVWDYKNDPTLNGLGKTCTSLPEFIRALAAPTFQLRYLVNHGADIKQQFDLFCRAAWRAGCLMMYVCELPEVTRAGSAPAAWRRCVNVGREYQEAGQRKWLSIVADGQRPPEVDKSVITNADIVHTGRLVFEDDAKAMARLMRCDPSELMTLADWHWIERRAGQIEPLRGGPTTKKPAGRKPVKKS